MPPADDKIGLLLIQIMKRHRYLAEHALSKIGLHVGQEAILIQLAESDGMRPSDLAACMDVEPPTITRVLQRMENTGLVERREDPEDGRATLICATEQAKSLLPAVDDIWTQLEQTTLANFSDVELALLRRLLNQMLDNLNKNSDL